MADKEQLRRSLKELSKAIQQALSRSEDLARIIEEIRGTGHDAFLILEATVAVRRREEGAAGALEQAPAAEGEELAGDDGALVDTWSGSDFDLLRELHLRLDAEPDAS